MMPGKQPVEHGRTRTANMQKAGWRGGKSRDYGIGFIKSHALCFPMLSAMLGECDAEWL